MGNVNVQPSKMLEVDSVNQLSFLDQGQFSKIYKGHFASTGQKVSIKVPKVPESIRKEKKLVKTHIEEVKKLMPLLKRARGDYVVKHFGVAYDDFRKEVWIVRDYIDGNDLETLLKNPSLCPSLRSPERKINIAVGISKGMSHLHHLRVPIVHGDLKPSDVIVEARTLTPKITNFGLWDFKNFFLRATMPEGSFLNPGQSPEILMHGERPNMFSDIWCLGATILVWMTAMPVWDFQDLTLRYRSRQDREISALKSALQNEEEPTVGLWVSENEEELDFLRDCFKYNPTERISAHEIEGRLVNLSQTPTWTNIAFHKYYGK